ncbi:MAG: DnaB-like helicase C-terminal domain-containing protein [Actinomycetes bacterium]
MSDELRSLSQVMRDADSLLAVGRRATAWAWPTGFPLLDTYLGGGIRAGELCLLGGPQGLGKTTFALQIARNVARGGGSCAMLSYEHDATTLLERLVALEAGELLGVDGVPLRRVREALEDVSMTSGSLEERLATTLGGAEAVAGVRTYAERMMLHRSLGSMTDLDAIREVVQATIDRTERRPLVVVDYLQKVFVPKMAVEEERVTVVVEGLKDMALDLEVPVVAIVAADKEGLGPGRRVRVHHLRGSSALAYEADIVLMLNDKYDIVARHHLVFDPSNADRFRQYVVLSVEKNRSGLDRIDVQLRKRFEQARYETEALAVDEQLLDDRVFKE